MKTKTNILRLTESAVMIALATVLSNIKFFEMPMGGSVTAFSMLPIVLIAYRYGLKWGLFTGGVYGVMQMLLGMHNLKYGTSILAVLVIILFDYVVAFAVLGFGAAFRKSVRSQPIALALGSILASLLRFLCHFVSGWVVWGVWAPEGMPAWQYSIAYNGYYMAPEALLTAVGLVLMSAYLDFTSENITRRLAKTETSPRSNTALTCKLAGVSTVAVGILYAIGEALAVLVAEDAEVNKLQLLTVFGAAALIGIVIYALGEIVQLLTDLRNK